jgi:dTDP-4-amino-4,6-dideoxygalactose transaminase
VSGSLSLALAYALRFDFEIPAAYSEQCLFLLPIIAAIKVIVFYLLGGHKVFWRYATLRDFLLGVTFSAICSVLLLLQYFVATSLYVPRGVIALDFLITLGSIGLLTVAGRILEGRVGSLFREQGLVRSRNVILLGGGNACGAIVRAILKNPDWRIRIAAIFDDDPSRREASVYGVPVNTNLKDIKSYVERNAVDAAILTVSTPDISVLQRIDNALAETGLTVKKLPQALEMLGSLVTADSEFVESRLSEFFAPDVVNFERSMGVETLSPPIPVVSPTLPDLQDVVNVVRESYSTGMVTSGKLVKLLEEEAKRLCKVEHAIAVSSGTSGLMLAFAVMHFDDAAEVIVPSFTFPATAQVLLWNRLTPVYVDCLPGTMTIDPEEVEKAISPKTAAIFPVNIFGAPPDLDELEVISKKHGIPLIYDSAQGLGSTFMGVPAGGFGVSEVFSLSPSKVITAMEGGIITTNDARLAQELRGMRDYGKDPRGEQMVSKGLSARMIEFDAAVGLLSIRNADSLIASRLRLVARYRKRFEGLSGCKLQEMPANRTSSGSHFCLLVSKAAGIDRDKLSDALKEKQIQTKKYFFPPVHAQQVFRDSPHRIVGDLANTWASSLTTLILPLYSHMTDIQQDRVCLEVESALRT